MGCSLAGRAPKEVISAPFNRGPCESPRSPDGPVRRRHWKGRVMNAPRDPFGAIGAISTPSGNVGIFSLVALAKRLGVSLERLPISIRVLLESALRYCDGYQVTEDDVRRLAAWDGATQEAVEVPSKPARVILQDFTGVPCVVDLAAMRDAVKRLGGDPKRINPLVPVDLVIDHSVQVDVFGNVLALERNAEIEF